MIRARYGRSFNTSNTVAKRLLTDVSTFARSELSIVTTPPVEERASALGTTNSTTVCATVFSLDAKDTVVATADAVAITVRRPPAISFLIFILTIRVKK